MLLRQFRPISTGSLQEQWLHHRQTGGVLEYRRKFIELIAPLTGVPEEIALAQFINGLSNEVKAEVRLLGAINLEHAMDLAVKVEEKFKSGGGRRGGITFQSGNSSPTSPKSQWSSLGSSGRSGSVYSYPTPSQSSLSPRSTSSMPIAKPMGKFKRLNDKELQLKRERGECFRCDEKWAIGHRCKKRELSVILMQGEAEGGEEGGVF